MKLVFIFAALLFAAPLQAQLVTSARPGWSVSLFGGGSAFTAFQRSRVEAIRTSENGLFERRDFSRRVSAKTAASFGGAIAYWPSPAWGLRLFGSYVPSRFETLIPQPEAALMELPQSSEDTASLAPLSILSADVDALVRLPSIKGVVMPYTFIGAGIVRYRTSHGDEPVPDEAVRDFASGSQVKPAARLGIGGSIPLGRRGLSLGFELSDQIAPTPLSRGGDRSVNVTNAFAFIVGLNLAF